MSLSVVEKRSATRAIDRAFQNVLGEMTAKYETAIKQGKPIKPAGKSFSRFELMAIHEAARNSIPDMKMPPRN